MLKNISASVDPTISSIKSDCESSRLQTQTYGWVKKMWKIAYHHEIFQTVQTSNSFRWAILAGAGLDIAADWFGESRQPVVSNL